MLPAVSGELGRHIRCPNLKTRTVRLPRSQAIGRLVVIRSKRENRGLEAAVDDQVFWVLWRGRATQGRTPTKRYRAVLRAYPRRTCGAALHTNALKALRLAHQHLLCG